MNLADYLRELAFPISSTQTLVALITFVVLISLASFAGMLGVYLLIAVVPAFLRYLTMIAEARAQGREAEPPGAEYFTLVGNAWTLFPVVPVLVAAMLITEIGTTLGGLAASIAAFAFAAALPAVVAVLVITHSVLESIKPLEIVRFIRGCGADYWYAPLTAVLIILIPQLLAFLPIWMQVVVEVYLLTAFFAVIGAVAREAGLFDEVDIPDATEPDAEKTLSVQEGQWLKVLNHAYGFISRDNRDGGLKHIYDWLADDPDPDRAWPWFFEQLMGWEDTYPGLLFAQQYVGRLLGTREHGRRSQTHDALSADQRRLSAPF